MRSFWGKNWPELHCMLRGGMPDFVLRSSPGEASGIPAFCYHTVEDEAFEQDLRHLDRNGYRTILADELLAVITGKQAMPERTVVLSFDDGHVNLYTTAFPLLERYGFRAVAFVAPAFHEPSFSPAWTARPCTWGELEVMHRSGIIDVQSHTFEHRYVPRWPEPAPLFEIPKELGLAPREPRFSLERDLLESRRLIEDRLGTEVRHLAFPRSEGTDVALDLARSVGYRACWWGTLPGRPCNDPTADPMRVVRVSGEFVRRLPGDGRAKLRPILARRYRRAAAKRMAREG